MKMKTIPKFAYFMICAAVSLVGSVRPVAGQVPLVNGENSGIEVVVSGDVLETATVDAPVRAPGRERDLQLLRLAAEDLVEYIEKLSGRRPELVTEATGERTPVYLVDAEAPPPVELPELTVSSPYGDAYAVDVNPDRILLQGESARAVHYAAARLLNSLGVRWYAPGEIGEHLPEGVVTEIPADRKESAPDYRTRHLWGNSPEEQRWLLRNRLGGPVQGQGHAFHRYMQGAEPQGESLFERHPEYYPIIDGKPVNAQANLSHPDVLERFVEGVRRDLAAGGLNHSDRMALSVGPDDGILVDERPESMAMNSGEVDLLVGVPCSTDLLVAFANKVAERIAPEFPDARLTFLVYSNHAQPPRTVEPHPMLEPIVAPISYSRFSSIANPASPTSMLLDAHVRAWLELSPTMGYYLYNFNLADTAMPFTRTLAFGKDIPYYHELGMRDGTIESMPNWHTMVPGNFLIANLFWDVETDRDALLEEAFQDYYGPAAAPMARYNAILEDIYENTPAYAGNFWSMHLILNPEVMEQLEAAYDEAAAKTEGREPYAERVAVHGYGLRYARAWLGARNALNRFDLQEAKAFADEFKRTYEEASARFPLFFTRMNLRYFEIFHETTFEEAGEIAERGEVVFRFPDEWLARFDVGDWGEDMGLHLPESDPSHWVRLRTYSASLAEQGLPHFRGEIWYRHDFELNGGADGPPLTLWFAGLNSTARVYLNGEYLGEYVGRNFGPAQVDVSEAIVRDGKNTLVVAVDNGDIVELGTGGIVRPVALVAETKVAVDGKDGTESSKPGPAERPLFGEQ